MCRPTRGSLAAFDDEWTNVMFVGRVIPNKKFENVIRAFHAYRTRHNPRSRLLLVGSYSGFERYLAMLQALIARLGTPDVHFLGHVSNEELTALYDVADLFLCASEHEGFCVPIVEAFHKRVPVLAYAATAVPATMDGGGVLYDTQDPLEIARLMDAVLDDGGSRTPSSPLRTRRSRGCARRISARRCCATSTQLLPPGRAGARSGVGLLGRSSTSSSGSRSCGSSGRRCFGRCRKSRDGARGSALGGSDTPRGRTPRSITAPSDASRTVSGVATFGSRPARRDRRPPRKPPMIINQWVPAAPQRRRDRRQRAGRARHAPARAATSRISSP